jgi:hypothetical protein
MIKAGITMQRFSICDGDEESAENVSWWPTQNVEGVLPEVLYKLPENFTL